MPRTTRITRASGCRGTRITRFGMPRTTRTERVSGCRRTTRIMLFQDGPRSPRNRGHIWRIARPPDPQRRGTTMALDSGGYPHEGLRRSQPAECRAGRPLRLRQDPARLRPALRCGGRQPLRQRRRGDDGHGLRRRRDRPQAHPLRQRRLRRVEQDQDQFHRHAGTGELPERRARGAARRGRGAGRRRRAARRRGLDREGVGDGRRSCRCRGSSR